MDAGFILSSPFGVLKNRDYRVYFIGQLITITGSWAQQVAQSWLVYRLTHSGYWLGVVTFANQMPAFVASFWAGAIADRVDRRKVLIATQVLVVFQSFALGFLVFSGKVQLWHVILLTTILGIETAFDSTTRHAFAVDMVGKQELANAIALNSVIINGSRILGPAIAGFLIGVVGEGWCFIVNGLSCFPVIIGLSRMQISSVRHGQPHQSLLLEIVQGIRYTRRHRVISKILILSAVICFLATSFMSIVPVFAGTILSGGAQTLAWLMGMLGVGAIFGSILYSPINEPGTLRKQVIRDIGFWGCSLIVLGFSRDFWVSLVGVFLIGYFMMSFFPTINNAIQQVVDDSMRGRVMSFYSMTFLGTVPLGSLVLGWVTDRVGAANAVIGAGVLTVLVSVVLAMHSAFIEDAVDSLTPSSQSRF